MAVIGCEYSGKVGLLSEPCIEVGVSQQRRLNHRTKLLVKAFAAGTSALRAKSCLNIQTLRDLQFEMLRLEWRSTCNVEGQ